jgi:hypothetical protein
MRLTIAAQGLAQRLNRLPDFEAERVSLSSLSGGDGPAEMIVWPVDKQMNKVFQELKWLRTCVATARHEAFKQKSKTGKGRGFEAFDRFLFDLEKLFRQESADCASIHEDRIKSEPDQRPTGNLFRFLEACLRPLGYDGKPSALYDRYYRAKAARSDLG